MIFLRVNRQLQITIALLCIAIAIALGITLNNDSPAAGQVYGQTTGSPTIPAANPATDTKTTGEKPDVSKPAVNNPESIIQLLKDSKETAKTYGQNNMGASFHGTFSLSVDGAMTYMTTDGHVIPTDRVSMNAEIHTPGGVVTDNGYSYEYGPQKMALEARLTGGNIYIRPDFSQKWISASVADLSDYDEDWDAVDFTQFIVNPEYLGQEKTKEGYPVYHVRISIDAAKVTAEAEKHIKPKICDKTKEEIAKLATSTVMEDIWIGVNDKLVYQATEKFLNTDLMIAYDDMIEFYRWGEKVDISPPPPQDVTTVDLGNSNNSVSCSA